MIGHDTLDTGYFPHKSTGKIPLPLAGCNRDNAGMAEPRKILTDRIHSRLDALGGRSARDVSMAVNGTPDLIRDIKRRKSMPAADVLDRLARELETTTDYLLGKADNSAQPASEIGVKELPAS